MRMNMRAPARAGNERVELQQFKRPPPRLPLQAALKKQKQISRAGADSGKPHDPTPAPCASFENEKSDPSCVRNFLLAAFRAALPLSERCPDVRFLSQADISACPRDVRFTLKSRHR